MKNDPFKFGGELTVDGAHLFPVRIYYEDTDFSGNVYHAAYLKFFERARTEFLRAHHVNHKQLQAEEGTAFAIKALNIEYIKGAHIDDLLEVATKIIDMRGSRLVLEQTIMRGDDIITKAKVTAVSIQQNGRPKRLPAAILKINE